MPAKFKMTTKVSISSDKLLAFAVAPSNVLEARKFLIEIRKKTGAFVIPAKVGVPFEFKAIYDSSDQISPMETIMPLAFGTKLTHELEEKMYQEISNLYPKLFWKLFVGPDGIGLEDPETDNREYLAQISFSPIRQFYTDLIEKINLDTTNFIVLRFPKKINNAMKLAGINYTYQNLIDGTYEDVKGEEWHEVFAPEAAFYPDKTQRDEIVAYLKENEIVLGTTPNKGHCFKTDNIKIDFNIDAKT